MVVQKQGTQLELGLWPADRGAAAAAPTRRGRRRIQPEFAFRFPGRGIYQPAAREIQPPEDPPVGADA
jgi:hypothetical protein